MQFIQTPPHSEAAIGLFMCKPLCLCGLLTVERQQKHLTALGLSYLSYVARNGLWYKSRVYKHIRLIFKHNQIVEGSDTWGYYSTMRTSKSHRQLWNNAASKKWKNSWGQMPVRNLPVWSVPTKFFLVDITGHKLNIATATFNILLKLNGVLDHKRPVLVTEFRELGWDSKMSGIYCCLYSWCSTESNGMHELKFLGLSRSACIGCSAINIYHQLRQEWHGWEVNLCHQDLQSISPLCAWTFLLSLHSFSSRIPPTESPNHLGIGTQDLSNIVKGL